MGDPDERSERETVVRGRQFFAARASLCERVVRHIIPGGFHFAGRADWLRLRSCILTLGLDSRGFVGRRRRWWTWTLPAAARIDFHLDLAGLFEGEISPTLLMQHRTGDA
jgi:hypothetical protein